MIPPAVGFVLRFAQNDKLNEMPRKAAGHESVALVWPRELVNQQYYLDHAGADRWK